MLWILEAGKVPECVFGNFAQIASFEDHYAVVVELFMDVAKDCERAVQMADDIAVVDDIKCPATERIAVQ